MNENSSNLKPYLVRAVYEWANDSGYTPYINVDTTFSNVMVPEQYIRDNQITLNISPTAAQELLIDNEALTCRARFGGIAHDIYVPIIAIGAIYAAENNQGMAFPPEIEDEESEITAPSPTKTKLQVITGGKD